MDNGSARRELEIYVAPDCVGCETAREIAGTLRALALPNVAVRLIELSESEVDRPSMVFAVPTYVLDGRVLSLGNPYEEWLVNQLRAAPGDLSSALSEEIND